MAIHIWAAIVSTLRRRPRGLAASIDRTSPRDLLGLLHDLVTGLACWQAAQLAGVGDDGFVCNQGQSPEGGLAASSVVGALDFGHSRSRCRRSVWSIWSVVIRVWSI